MSSRFFDMASCSGVSPSESCNKRPQCGNHKNKESLSDLNVQEFYKKVGLT